MIFALLIAWAALALWFDSSYPKALTTLILLVSISVFLYIERWLMRFIALGLQFAAVLSWWLQIAPSNSRNWQEDVARLPAVEINGDQIIIHNVRDFDYRSETDFTPHWEERIYYLSQLHGVDLTLSDWGAAAILHTIVSWDFGPGQYLAISIETRKKVGDSYSAIRGFFRQYELYYVVADERDVIGVRAKYRGEDLHMYRIRMPPSVVRSVFLSYAAEINRLHVQPEWYNAATDNCTTSIRLQVKNAGAEKPLNWRLFANKFLDKLLYSRGVLNTSFSFAALKARSDITAAACSAIKDPNFSEVIRSNLPLR